MPPPLMTIRQAADQLGVCYNTIRNAIRSGRLPAFRFGERGGTYRIDPLALETFKSGCAIKPQSRSVRRRATAQTRFQELDGTRLVHAWERQGVVPGPDHNA